MARSGGVQLTGSRLMLGAWLGIGFLGWVVHRPLDLARRWLRRPRLVQGDLVFATKSSEAAELLHPLLTEMKRGGALFRVLHVEDIGRTARPARPTEQGRTDGPENAAGLAKGSGSASDLPAETGGAYAWSVAVRPGTETAMLRMIRFRLARSMARRDGYVRLDWRIALFLAERIVSGNQVRRIELAARDAPPAKVTFTEHHDRYRDWICTGPEPSHSVRVAILDTAVQLTDLPDNIRGQVSNEAMPQAPKPFAHGAIMAAIVADLARNADITVYPIRGFKGEDATEVGVLRWLGALAIQPEPPDIVLMSFSFIDRTPIPQRTVFTRAGIEDVIRFRTKTASVVAAGNDGPRRPVAFPAVCAGAIAVGAVGADKKVPSYSRFLIPADARGPARFCLAPGGSETQGENADAPVMAGTEPMIGTSVAAAYAAGVMARLLGEVERDARGDVAALFDLLERAADQTLADPSSETLQLGLIRQMARALPGPEAAAQP
jgi:hypothetical protein